MIRSKKKGPFVSIYIQEKIIFIHKKSIKYIVVTWSRISIIIPIIVGHTIFVYNGYYHISFFINGQIVRHKLGEFFVTKLDNF